MLTGQPNAMRDVHILIAEDSPTQAERLRYTLERQGYHVDAAKNGREALAKARASRPTLVISDIVMPEMDGYELCQSIKADPALQDVPVILVTTLSDPQDVIRGLECRADNFVIKPYDDQYLVSRIQFVLLNYEVRKHDPAGMAIEIFFNGQRHFITADRLQILNLLLSTYEAAIQRNQELTRAKDALRDANSALEAMNKELEAFSYSVSHDLRAPLRAIEGFSQNLADECASQLGPKHKDLLQRVQSACQRMKQLIEDLLNLSRIGRSEMQHAQVDLSALAASVAHDIQRTQPDRRAHFNVTPGLFATCDARLMRIVFENLMGNAWKFSARQELATIEFGRLTGSENAFFVRDNGAGFDMAFADKLFGAFQRLHSTSEFPGTGIGLATVQRIIHRHGGRIWAQSAPGRGATFFFTLKS
ncbi:MAG TPA: response regulator [Phycisphaerae bacterium]|nr:response regulator [Phycisphaerae bacterium]